MDIVKVSKGFTISIPRPLREKTGLKEGDEVQINVLQQGEVILKAVDSELWAEKTINRAITEADEITINEDTFDKEYEEMQEAIWRRTDHFSEAEIKNDIATAIGEVRAERNGRKKLQ